MQVTLDIDALSDLLFRASEYGSTRALEAVKVQISTITLAEIKKIHGVKMANLARMAEGIVWLPNGIGGAKSGVYCKRSEFDKWLFKREFSFNSPK